MILSGPRVFVILALVTIMALVAFASRAHRVIVESLTQQAYRQQRQIDHHEMRHDVLQERLERWEERAQRAYVAYRVTNGQRLRRARLGR